MPITRPHHEILKKALNQKTCLTTVSSFERIVVIRKPFVMKIRIEVLKWLVLTFMKFKPSMDYEISLSLI